MSAHLEEHELSSAVAGLDLDEAAREHLRSCLVCRRQVAAMEDLIGERRDRRCHLIGSRDFGDVGVDHSPRRRREQPHVDAEAASELSGPTDHDTVHRGRCGPRPGGARFDLRGRGRPELLGADDAPDSTSSEQISEERRKVGHLDT